MRSNCGAKKLAVLEEGEVVTGSTTTTDSQDTHRQSTQHQVGTLFGVPVTSGQAAGIDTRSSSNSVNTYEWQISYECQDEKKSTKR